MSVQRQQWVARHTWHILVWLLIYTATWDAIGLLAGGDRWFTGPSYDVLRLLARQIGGMRALGVPLGIICMSLMIATIWLYGKHSAGRRPTRAFPVCLSLLAGWYAAWSVTIIWANVNEWLANRDLLGWSSVSKLGFVTLVAIVVASLPPPPPAPYRKRAAPALNGGNGRDLSG